MNNSAITVTNLTKKFGDFTAVDDISFEAKRGEIFGFLGPNGSGKTTTIRMMLGLLTPSAGNIQALGMSVNGNQAEFQRRVGYMSQRFSLYNDLTVLQNLQFYGAAYGLDNHTLKERIQDALVMAGLKGRENTKTRDLSGGWRQRLALNAAVLHRPELLFLDEPTAGVDPISRRAFWDLLYQLVGEGISVFVTTHYMDEAEHCHHLCFIQRGKIIADGELAGLSWVQPLPSNVHVSEPKRWAWASKPPNNTRPPEPICRIPPPYGAITWSTTRRVPAVEPSVTHKSRPAPTGSAAKKRRSPAGVNICGVREFDEQRLSTFEVPAAVPSLDQSSQPPTGCTVNIKREPICINCRASAGRAATRTVVVPSVRHSALPALPPLRK